MMDQATVTRFYRRPNIQRAILENANGREVAVKYGQRGFGKRPDLLRYPGDVGELAAQGATSFHISEERWSNPLHIVTGMSRDRADELRSGWDLVIDIDSPELEYSKLTTYYVIEWLRHHGIASVSCKFSGNKGFHIGVPFEAFPERIGGKRTASLFPEAPRRIAAFMIEKITEPLALHIHRLEDGNLHEIARKSGFGSKEDITLIKNGVSIVDITKLIEVDTVLISSRHLYRSVYSFNEKSGLISVPISPDEVLAFSREMAAPDRSLSEHIFLDPANANAKECLSLFTEAYDFLPEIVTEEKPEFTPFEIPEDAIPKELFPPCIKAISKGLSDGKKRALFMLINFLKSCGWQDDQIEAYAKEWNRANPTPLRENLLIGQIRYSKGRQAMLPANCSNSIYNDLHVCSPDNLCKYIKNPVNYSRKKTKKH